MEATAVYPAPKSGLAPVAKLAQGRYVYRCEERGEWLGVMFPAEGEKVDCSERRPERACSLGWIGQRTKMRVLGSVSEVRVWAVNVTEDKARQHSKQ